MKTEIKAKISQLISDATDEDNIGNRSDLLDVYNAEPYGDEVSGRSAFVSSDAADAVEAMLPDIMDVFTGGEDILEFSPIGPDDEPAAKQETQVVSHVFWHLNPGFETLYTWTKEGMIQQNAYVWRGWVEKERVTFEEYEGLTVDGLLSVLDGLEGEYELQEQSGFEIVQDPETGAEMLVPEVDEQGQPAEASVKIKCVKADKEYVIEPFPQEDYFGTPRWGRLGLEGIPCCGRRHRDKRVEDFVALGFDRESVEALGKSEGDDEASSARHHTRDLDESEANDETIEVYEAYLNVDMDDDGILELVRVWCSNDGTQILKWKDGSDAVDPVGSIPINALTPYIMPHRHIGRSVVEQVDDIQRVNSVLMRHMLDSTYMTNHPRPYFDENSAGEHTFDDLVQPTPGAPVRTGGAEIAWHAPPPVAGAVLPLLEKFDAMKEARVGATRYNQGLDANSLNKTASGISQIMNASQKKTKLIARTIAETALKELFVGIHRDLRAGPMKALAIKLAGQWTEVDPTSWRERSDMVVNVGMGRGDRDEVRMGLTMLGQVQEKLVGTGMVSPKNIYNSIVRALETFGITNPDPFITDPDTIPPKPPEPPQPDPIMISAQAQAQKVQTDAQIAIQRLQMEAAEAERRHAERMLELQIRKMAEERAQAKAASDIQTDDERLELERNKAVLQDDFNRDKLKVEAAAGYMRDVQKAVSSEPPVSYEQVTKD